MFNPMELKAARIRRGYSQAALAKILKTSAGNYCNKENGKQSMSLKDVNAITDALNLTQDEVRVIFFAKEIASNGKSAPPRTLTVATGLHGCTKDFYLDGGSQAQK